MSVGRVLWAVIVALFAVFAVAGPVIMVRDAARAGEAEAVAAPPEAGEPIVAMADIQFRPGTLQVPAGSTVLWSNQDVAPHTVTTDVADSGLIDPGESFTMTVTESFEYICTLHSSMSGAIQVT